MCIRDSDLVKYFKQGVVESPKATFERYKGYRVIHERNVNLIQVYGAVESVAFMEEVTEQRFVQYLRAGLTEETILLIRADIPQTYGDLEAALQKAERIWQWHIRVLDERIQLKAATRQLVTSTGLSATTTTTAATAISTTGVVRPEHMQAVLLILANPYGKLLIRVQLASVGWFS